MHAYTGMAGGRITYLSELESGGQVLAVDAHGNSRTVLVGRVCIESRPLVLVVVDVAGETFSVMLQESDSVRLVVPAGATMLLPSLDLSAALLISFCCQPITIPFH